MRIIKILICILLAFSAAGCDKRAGRVFLLTGDLSINDYISLEGDSVSMFASPADKKEGRVECRIYENEYPVFVKMFTALDDEAIVEAYRSKGSARFAQEIVKKINSAEPGGPSPVTNPGRPLAGMRVAIDPGHSAGTFEGAIRESKYMWIFTRSGAPIKFYESQLNFATAAILKEMLEKAGARVMITRGPGRQAYPAAFDVWVRKNFFQAVRERLRGGYITREQADHLLSRAGDEARLKFFNSEVEMPYRAKLINAFRPHITVLVHYDSRDDDTAYRSKYLRIKDIVGKKYPSPGRKLREIEEVVKSVSETDRDYCTVFVPGCFLRGELNSVESRIEFLRLVISPDLDNSIIFSGYVLDNFQAILNVPPAREFSYEAKPVGAFSAGLFSRNFRMTRLVRGVLCLGEPLLQNNMQEAVELSDIAKGSVPERVKLVARSYYEAIKRYAKKK